MSLNRRASVGTKILIGLVVFVTVFGIGRYLPLTREGRRLERVGAARKHAEVVAPLLAKEKRFMAVRVSEWYSGDGFFLVDGYLESETDLQDLKQIIEASKPPAPVAWQVKVVGETNKPVENR